MHHEQDMRNMGGLRKYMPITWITSLIGSLALIGTPFFSGFYSKDSDHRGGARASHIAGLRLRVLRACWPACSSRRFYSFRLYVPGVPRQGALRQPSITHRCATDATSTARRARSRHGHGHGARAARIAVGRHAAADAAGDSVGRHRLPDIGPMLFGDFFRRRRSSSAESASARCDELAAGIPRRARDGAARLHLAAVLARRSPASRRAGSCT